jgi:hypothetical protein
MLPLQSVPDLALRSHPPWQTKLSDLPTPLDSEAAGFEEGLEAVGLVALDFDRAPVNLTATAEGRFQFAQEVFRLSRVPSGRKSFENQNGFAAAVRGGAAEEEAFFGFLFRGGLRGRRLRGCVTQWSEIELGEGTGSQFRCGVRGDALFVLPRHVISAASASS